MAPLWNRALPIDTTYQTYGSPNFDGAGPTAGKPKGVSLACLSCHDGTVAVDALINGPGSGGYINDNTITGGSTSSPLITLTANGIIDVANSSMLEGVRNGADQTTASCSPYCGGIHDTLTDTSLAEGAQPFPNLGINLGDDHPVGMQVPISGFNAEGGGGTSTDPQFALIGTFSTVGPGGVDGVNVKFISKDGILAADKRDRLRAYPSTTSAGLAGAYYIECASCHNPHTPRVSFLRLPSSLKKPNGSYEHIDGPTDPIPATWSSVDSNLKWGNKPNSGSAICLSCHQK
jgi:formate-dependent nitrite reductase cytochrome c552 subunit